MGIRKRRRQRYLHVKLFSIRTHFGLSQPELLMALGLARDFSATNISAYERGVIEPPYYVLLKYAEFAGVCTDVLIDDRRKLPAKLLGLRLRGSVESEDVSLLKGESANGEKSIRAFFAGVLSTTEPSGRHRCRH